ncbi:MAG: protein kinase, partial [Lacisediminihabitans sp.]
MDIIGGYRLVRRLGVGDRAEVFLGHSDRADATHGSTVAIKIFRPGVDEHSIDEEVAVLSRTNSRHLLRVNDVATAATGRHCLVLPRLSGGSLGRLLADRTQLEPGEVVTILAPLADAIAQLHELGCCHGSLRPRSVHFDELGAPVLACFGRATTFGIRKGTEEITQATPAEMMAEPRVADDVQQLRTLAVLVLARTAQGHTSATEPELLEWLNATQLAAAVTTFPRELRDRLFDLAPALPVGVQLEPKPQPSRSPASGPHLMVREDSGRAADQPALDGSSSRPETSVTRSLLSRVRTSFASRFRDAVVEPAHQPTEALLRRLVPALTKVRRPFWIAGGIGFAALVLAVALVTSASGSRQVHRSETGVSAQSSASSREESASTRPSAPTTVAVNGSQASDGAEAATDDPVAAVSVLLRTRERCIR